jgi:hypothetical protein
LIGTDQRQGRQHPKAGDMAAPERFAKRSDSFPLQCGCRPYMAHSVSAGMSAFTHGLGE